MKKILTLACLVFLSACSYPQTKTTTVNDPPTFVFIGAPDQANLYVNGLLIGPADNYNGKPNSLIVPRGTHLVEIKQAGRILFSEKAFISDGSTKTFEMTGLK